MRPGWVGVQRKDTFSQPHPSSGFCTDDAADFIADFSSNLLADGIAEHDAHFYTELSAHSCADCASGSSHGEPDSITDGPANSCAYRAADGVSDYRAADRVSDQLALNSAFYNAVRHAIHDTNRHIIPRGFRCSRSRGPQLPKTRELILWAGKPRAQGGNSGTQGPRDPRSMTSMLRGWEI